MLIEPNVSENVVIGASEPASTDPEMYLVLGVPNNGDTEWPIKEGSTLKDARGYIRDNPLNDDWGWHYEIATPDGRRLQG